MLKNLWVTEKSLDYTKVFVYVSTKPFVRRFVLINGKQKGLVMTKKIAPKPTNAELEILQILWSEGPSTVKVINDRLSEKKEVRYTTTLKLMQIMLEKGLLKRNEQNRSHIYVPTIQENETQKLLLNKLMETAFGGSAMKLVMQALGNGKTSKEEIDQIREYLKKIESDNK